MTVEGLDMDLTPEEMIQKMRETPWQYLHMPPKPIVVIYLPENYSVDGRDREDAPMELMKALNGNFGNNVESDRIYPDYWKEYYWFCFTKYGMIDAPEFKVFHPKDFTDIQFQELKDMVMADLEEMKLNHQSK